METSNQRHFNILIKEGWNIPEKGDLQRIWFKNLCCLQCDTRQHKGSSTSPAEFTCTHYTWFMDRCHASRHPIHIVSCHASNRAVRFLEKASLYGFID
ncbi:hypothetical protein PoB_003903400 [Plakobranchus ocellatus]|uniref:Uncharacterized protein n=1 Tax=Plakobranchus ocellatus TaxID=259542 RepID=A0AAV4AXM8_9GAST|nr:hypothetical protein PoB_003903400 [Plakobranchus ocellatus]